ncbi:hypothetical protein TNCV_839141 [Trichonephila clavipes]|nr:hypothetical protein TNCV_839141 [Trichonephila clavipes]
MFTMGTPYTNMIVITAEIEYGFIAKDDLVAFCCSPVSLCVSPFQIKASMSGHQGFIVDCHGVQNGSENKHVVLFQTWEIGKETLEMLKEVYKDEAITSKSVYEWFKCLWEGRTSMEDAS